MNGKRVAVMYLALDLVEALLPPDKTVSCLQTDTLGRKNPDFALLHDLLRLPSDARVTGLSLFVRFLKNQLAVRVECPAFKFVPQEEEMDEVMAVYARNGYEHARDVDGDCAFLRWEGPAVDPLYQYTPPPHPSSKRREFL